MHSLIIAHLQQNVSQRNIELAAKRALDYILSLPYNNNLAEEGRKIADALYNKTLTEQDISIFIEWLETYKPEILAKHNNSIAIEQVSKSYANGVFQFNAVSFELRKGELTGVVGQNGNGKTTLLRMLAYELSASSGNINYPLESDNPYAVKEIIGFIPQRIDRWFGELEDNLIYELSIRKYRADEIKFRVEIILKRFQLYDYRMYNWQQISSGYRTRFELAKVVLLKPEVLILDEPLANLDIKAQQTFLQDLRLLAQSPVHPMAVIFSSQQLHEVEQVSDYIAFIKQGNCIIHTTKKELNQNKQIIIEFISETAFSVIETFCKQNQLTLSSENNLYTLTSTTEKDYKEILKLLVNSEIEIDYLRNITNSTKCYF